ncbi:hypothetical protein [Roseobacter sp. HKCCA0882]|uniref:hypothetical protein n=1 Tax=Roseobacter sp. HKCCA0882 TaxID=3120337 RepID=UPI0030ED5D51
MKKDKRDLWCIVGTGRNGSSLLSGTLHGLGKDFGHNFKSEWDKSSGNFEHPMLHQAFSFLFRADSLRKIPFCNKLANYYYRKVDRCMTSVAASASFLKSSKLLYLVPYIPRNKYNVKLIILIRKFDDYCLSRHARFNAPFDEIKDKYIRDMKQLSMLASVHEHIVVDFDDLLNDTAVGVLDEIAHFVGIEPHKLHLSSATVKKPDGRAKIVSSYFPLSIEADQEFMRLKRL